MNKSKIFLAVVLTFFLFGTLSGCAPKGKECFKTYSDTENFDVKVTFEYPCSWETDVKGGMTLSASGTVVAPDKKASFYLISLDMGLHEMEFIEEGSITMNGKKYGTREFEGLGTTLVMIETPEELTFPYMPEGGYNMMFSYEDESHREELEQIVSTIKFEEKPGEAGEEDDRILLTPENTSKFFSPDNEEFSEEEFIGGDADESVTYSNEEMGISVDIPYNKKWGSDNFRLNPYDYHESDQEDLAGFLKFGPMYRFEAGTVVRAYDLYFHTAKTAEEVMNEKSMMNPEKTEINGLTVVKFTDVGMCNYPTLYVIGEKYNYEFRPLCSVDDEKEFEFLEGIVRSVKLTD